MRSGFTIAKSQQTTRNDGREVGKIFGKLIGGDRRSHPVQQIHDANDGFRFVRAALIVFDERQR